MSKAESGSELPAKRENTRRFWTVVELNRLKALYPNTPMFELVRVLNRPATAIWSKVKELGVKRSADFLASKHSGRVGAGNCRGLATRFQKSESGSELPAKRANTRRFWTVVELNRLEALYPNTPMVDLVRELNRPATAICSKAKELGVKRSADFLASKHSGRVGAENCRGLATRFQKSSDARS